jgi:hypothetical protein
MKRRNAATLASLAGIVWFGGCGSSNTNTTSGVCTGGSTPNTCGAVPVSGGGLLQSFTPPCDPGGGHILLSASGEVLALGGYSFPPATPDDVAFVDGWEFTFDKVLVTFDHVRFSQNPDMVPTDQSKTGAPFAQVNGPWAVDLHKGGPLPGKGGGGEQAVAIAAVACAFDSTQRYAFSFDAVPATASAKNVNLDLSSPTTSDYTDYQEMIARGYTVLYVGTATWKGDQGGASCIQADSGTATPYDFTAAAGFPQQVKFRLGFATPAAYINCQNPDNDPATPFTGEEHQRGIQVKTNASTIAQVTYHTDHPLWDSFLHESPLHFDQIAAQNVGASGVPTATLDQMIGLNFEAFTDSSPSPRALPWRYCSNANGPPNTPLYSTLAPQIRFNRLTVPFVLNGTNPGAALRDYRDFMQYGQSTQGHLNADGLCFVQRSYPSPP